MAIQKATPTIVLIACFILICGCQLKEVFVDAAEIDQQLVNYARPENGATIFVSEENATHPASTLTNGIVGSENWDSGEGWEVKFEDAYAYGRYAGAGENAWFAERAMLQQARLRGEPVDTRQRVNPREFEDDDYKTRGTSVMGYGGSVSSAMGWVIIEQPEEKLITRVIVHTIDSEQYPAHRYGVRDFSVQFWASQAGGWQKVNRLNKKVGDQHDSIRNNKKGRVVVRFQPVKTSKIRLLIRWTNDSETYRKTRYNRYVRGTIRLTEIEIYGLEKRDEIAATSSIATDEDERMLDELLMERSTAVISEIPPEPSIDEMDGTARPAAKATVFNPDSEVESVIRAYESAYKNRDLPTIMETISRTYSRGNEDYAKLKKKMQSLFEIYTQLEIQLQRLRIDVIPPTATVASDYSIVLASVDSPSTSVSGKLFFTLKQSNNEWKITRIDTQK